MYNVKEYKCVMFNGKRQYVAHNCYDRGTRFSVYPHADILQFAEAALRSLASTRPCSLIDGLVRVDLFQRKNGSLVVNEFESFEADHHCSQHYNSVLEFQLNCKIDCVYKAAMYKYVDVSYMS